MKAARKHQPNRLRIIGGSWRGRVIEFADVPGLRPTPDRVRETLFNWLQPVISGARCLDLFAGSGALGFEALSRGAASVVMVDRDPAVVRTLDAVAQKLAANGLRVIRGDGIQWAGAGGEPFDIVFLDPPFADDLIATTCAVLEEHARLADSACIYLETPRSEDVPQLPAGWKITRSRTAGQVAFHLAERVAEQSERK